MGTLQGNKEPMHTDRETEDSQRCHQTSDWSQQTGQRRNPEERRNQKGEKQTSRDAPSEMGHDGGKCRGAAVGPEEAA